MGVRRPDGEVAAGDAVADFRVRAEAVVQAGVAAFVEKVKIEVAELAGDGLDG